jgi:CubicO group peptidase (beta-lactamase class C family)
MSTVPASSHPLLRAVAALLAVGVVALGACSDDSDSATTTTGPPTTEASTSTIDRVEAVPGDEWETVSAEDAGLDPAVLEDLAEQAEAADSFCLAVTRDGRLVDEWYWDGTGPQDPHEAFSVSKSFTSALVGIASDDGALTIGDPATDAIPEWSGTPSAGITIEHLLNNTSGREQSLMTDYVEMAAQSPDKTGFSIALGQDAEPGTTWVYNNAAIQTLDRVLEVATGQEPADFAEQRLFGPLGMADTSINRDASGNTLTFMGVQSTCRDLARFGTMMLQDGRWGDEQVLSEQWVEDSTGRSSQELNAAYGWLWWLNRPGPVLGAVQASGGEGVEPRDRLVPGAPEDMFFALGLGGQTIAVDPGSGTVVTRMAPSGDIGDSLDEPGFGAKQAALVATEAVTD